MVESVLFTVVCAGSLMCFVCLPCFSIPEEVHLQIKV